MQLFIDSYGAFLGLKDGLFFVKPRLNPPKSFPLRDISAIFISKGTRVTADALILATQNQIPIIFIDAIGHPIAQIFSGQFGSIATIRKNQALFSNSIDCMDFIRQVIFEKLDHQKKIISDLPPNPINSEATAIIQKMSDKFLSWQKSKISLSDTAATFRGWEGTASRFYFQALSAALPPIFQFKTRSKRPALDPFNALLNYLYGILYAQTQLAIIKAGLDPYIGFLHADQYNSPSLVFDLIEPIRHWADHSALQLCAQAQLSPQDFHAPSPKEGFLLATSGKNAAINAITTFMQQKITIDNLPRRRITHLDLACTRLATFLKDFNPNP
jgi:CRISP-associated protein Cas1